MTLLQLRYLCEIVDRGMNISAAAVALHTSQPGMSRQIQALERELGVTIFLRSKRRILGLTETGAQVREIARKVLHATDGLRHIGRDFSTLDSGTLTVTTSHTHARYILPGIIQAFSRKYPKVRITLRQGNPVQVAHLVNTGKADLSICSRPAQEIPGLALIPCYDQHKVVLTPARHPLLRMNHLTIRALARYPLITYDSEFPTYAQVMQAFAAEDCEPNVILSATDVDVMKEYVKRGLGVAIVAALAYKAKEDRGLRAIDARHLFESNKIYVGVQKHTYIRGYVFEFVRLFAPKITREIMERAVSSD